MSVPKWKRRRLVRIRKPDGRIVRDDFDYGVLLIKSGKAVIVKRDPFTIQRTVDYRDELKRQRGRRMEGVTRHRFCGRYTTSNPNRVMFPQKQGREYASTTD